MLFDAGLAGYKSWCLEINNVCCRDDMVRLGEG
jgi:hypothetical protein